MGVKWKECECRKSKADFFLYLCAKGQTTLLFCSNSKWRNCRYAQVSNLNTDVSVCKIHRYILQDTWKFNESRICWHNSRISAPSRRYFLLFHKNVRWECVKDRDGHEWKVKPLWEKWKQFDETCKTLSLKKKFTPLHWQNLKLLYTIHKHERRCWPVSCSQEQDSPIFPSSRQC